MCVHRNVLQHLSILTVSGAMKDLVFQHRNGAANVSNRVTRVGLVLEGQLKPSGAQGFLKIQKPTQTFRRQNGEIKKILQPGPIKRQAPQKKCVPPRRPAARDMFTPAQALKLRY